MSGTKEKVTAAVQAVDEEAEAQAQGFVKMIKDGVVSFVHEMTVDAHRAVGWVVAEFKKL